MTRQGPRVRHSHSDHTCVNSTDAWLEHQRRRFTRHDAQRWWRCDAVRYQRFDPRFQRGRTQFDDKAWPERSPDEFDREWQLALHRAQLQHAQLRHEWALLRNELLGKSWEDQPRVPPGSPEGGQWTSSEGQNEPRILSDATPDRIKPGDQLAQRQPPRGPFPGPTPAQNARLAVTQMRADAAIRRVQEIDPNWRPRETSLTVPNSIEGDIARAEARTEAAETRLRELARESHGKLLEAYRENNATPDLFRHPWSRENHYGRGGHAGTTAGVLRHEFPSAHLHLQGCSHCGAGTCLNDRAVPASHEHARPPRLPQLFTVPRRIDDPFQDEGRFWWHTGRPRPRDHSRPHDVSCLRISAAASRQAPGES